MRKGIFLLIALLLPILILLFLGNQAVDASSLLLPLQPPPSISIVSPTNNGNYCSTVPLVFVLPTNGTFNLPVGYEGGPGGNGKGVWGTDGFSYSLDDQANVTISGNTTLNGLPDGQHIITVFVGRWVYYGLYYGGYEDSFSNCVSFNIYRPVDINILSLENKTYMTSEVPLNFTLSKPAQWIGYSIDEKANVTLAGNTTLTSLANGAHNLTIYANDKAGNMGRSGTLNFNVDVPSQSTSFMAVEVGVPASAAVMAILSFVVFRKRRA
jgi:hypothetical protein